MSTTPPGPPARRLGAALREGEQVTPLELFFDLVFVLAITQCTALMANDPTWRGMAKGMLALGILWWAWVGYAWLTSVIDPDDGLVRIAMFAAMAALLVVSLCVPEAFDDLGLLFASAYGLVRLGQLALFLVAARDDPPLRRSVWVGLLPSTSVGIGLLAIASFVNGVAQGAIWATALGLDMLGPYLFGSEGWKLSPGHFAERHGLIVIIALGESIVAIGVGSEAGVDTGVVLAAVLATALVAAMWWCYFDVSSVAAARLLRTAGLGKEQNELARDAYSFLHFPMVAGVVLMALGLKKTIGHVGSPLRPETGFALVGGVVIYLLALVAFRFRNTRSIGVPRLALGGLLLALTPLADRLDSGYTLALLTVAMVGLVAYETIRFADGRQLIRRAEGGASTSP
jgi:low temperature requirement protein LtrA